PSRCVRSRAQAARLLPVHPPPRSALFPYTTLFRSALLAYRLPQVKIFVGKNRAKLAHQIAPDFDLLILDDGFQHRKLYRDVDIRSEEHTSELQSRENLVCRLLLEKKNLPAIGDTNV